MSYNTQQTVFGVGFKPQAALQTANAEAEFWRLSRVNAGFLKFGLTTETDSAEVGKGSEFAQAVFPVSYDISGSLEKILSSELAAWAFAFGLGTANMTHAAGVYTFTPMDACDGLDMPAFSVVEQIGLGCPGGAGLDRMAIGCAINDFSIRFQSGPGRSSAMLNVNFVGCGKNVLPSGIALPATKLVEHECRGGSAAVTVNGVDYTAGKGLMSLEMNFSNNVRLDQGFYVGSGVQDNAAIRGRLERGPREYGMTFTTRLEKTSLEYTKLKALTPGAATVLLTNSATESVQVAYNKVVFSSVDLADDNGIAVVQVTVTPLEDATGILTATVKTAVNAIGGAA
jgi:hypothetical protein